MQNYCCRDDIFVQFYRFLAATSNENDIAILRTEQMSFNSRVAPVCLPANLADDYSGQMAVVAGWGYTSPGKSVVSNSYYYIYLFFVIHL